MPDVTYSMQGVKKTCVAFAQKVGVLWPLLGRRSLHDDDVILDTEALQRRWRKRLEALKLHGWADVTKDGVAQFARNCPPASVKAFGPKALRPCKLRGICPFCHMRTVAKVFNAVARHLPVKEKELNPGIRLLEVSGKMLIRRAHAGKYLSGQLLEWSVVPKKLLKRLRPLGAYRRVTLDPKVVAGQFSGYRFQYNILAMVPYDWEIPRWLDNGNRRVKLTHVQSRGQLINVISRTCRYPVGLMKGDLRMTIVSLNARRGKRLSEFVGCLRATESRNASCND
jgi:hypothetical protein